MANRKAKVYLQVANRRPSGGWGASATVVNATNTMPTRVAPGCIVIPLEIEIPLSLWAENAKPLAVVVPEQTEWATATVEPIAEAVAELTADHE